MYGILSFQTKVKTLVSSQHKAERMLSGYYPGAEIEFISFHSKPLRGSKISMAAVLAFWRDVGDRILLKTAKEYLGETRALKL